MTIVQFLTNAKVLRIAIHAVPKKTHRVRMSRDCLKWIIECSRALRFASARTPMSIDGCGIIEDIDYSPVSGNFSAGSDLEPYRSASAEGEFMHTLGLTREARLCGLGGLSLFELST